VEFDVDRCRRRPDTRVALIYLDSSTIDLIAKADPAAANVSASLTRARQEGRAIGVGSHWHDDEQALIPIGPTLNANVRTLRTYTQDLRMKFESELITGELFAAAHEFCGEVEPITWKEAFRGNPDEPPLTEFQAEWMNEREEFERRPATVEEVEHERRTSQSLNQANLQLRGEHEWEAIAEGNLWQQIRHYLAPLADRNYYFATAEKLTAAAEQAGATGAPRSAASLYGRFAEVTHMANEIANRFSPISADPQAFCTSAAVTYLPTMRLFSFLLAALSADGKRVSPQAGDLHDIWHLTYGLSRCDIVTADKRSCELVHGRNLVPAGAQLFQAHHGLDQAAAAIDALRTQP
jgi:hypothetical protein